MVYVNPDGPVTHIDQKVRFHRKELVHEARKAIIFDEKKKPVILLNNNFDFTAGDISELYWLRWTIESLYKQIKQNFPLHFFYGDSVMPFRLRLY